MTELTDADLDLLRAEGCLVDLDVMAKATWDGYVRREETRDPFYHPPPYEGLVDPYFGGTGQAMRDYAADGLRAAGLVPAAPAVHLILAAIEGRGWGWPETTLDGRSLLVFTSTWRQGLRVRGESDHPDWRTRLALAFVAAIRSLRQEDPTDG